MEAEGARAVALSRQVDSLQGLISKMEQDVKSAAKAAETASLQGAPATINGKPESGGAERPRPVEPCHCLCVRQGFIRDAG